MVIPQNFRIRGEQETIVASSEGKTRRMGVNGVENFWTWRHLCLGRCGKLISDRVRGKGPNQNYCDECKRKRADARERERRRRKRD